MLGKEYFRVDGTGYTPSGFQYEIQAVEEVEQSEAGTDLINIIRMDKYVFKTSWEGIDADLLDELVAMCKRATVNVTYRNKTYCCRARGIDPKLAKKAYNYRHSDGLWDVSVTFTQI